MVELLRERKARIFLVGYAVSIFGTGFVYPLTAIYLNSVVMATVKEISLYFFLVGGCSFIAAPLSGLLSDRIGCRPVGVGSVALQAFGALLISLSPSFSSAVVGGMILGLGNGCFYGVQTSLLFAIFGKARLTKIFGIQYMVMNVAVAVSGVAGGAVASLLGSVGFRICYFFNSLSFLAYGIALFVCLGHPAVPGPEASGDKADKGEPGCRMGAAKVIRTPFFRRVLLPLAIIQFILAGFGFSQMDSVMPLVFVNYGHYDIGISGVFLSMNCIAVVLSQARAEKFVSRHGKERALLTASAIWCFATVFSVLAVVFAPGTSMGIVFVCLYAIVFGFGETLVSPSVQPLIVDHAPKSCLGFCSSAVNTMYSLGTMVGPALTLGLISQSDCTGIWFAIFPMLIVAALGALFLSKGTKRCEGDVVQS